MPEEVRGWDRTDWGESFQVDRPLEEANADDYDALVLPGGRINPDKLRRETSVQSLIRAFFAQGKPVAAICHGPWLLIDAGMVKGKKMTSYHSIQSDLKNAGANWVDEPVVVDENLITSRNPEDLEVFSAKIVEMLAQHAPGSRTASGSK
jgi:protease I